MYAILRKRQMQAAKQQATAKAAVVLPEQTVPEGTTTLADKPWEEVQTTLKQDLSYVRTLAGSQEKNPFKETLIAKYQPVVEKLLASHDNLANLDVVWWYFNWQVDTGNLETVHDTFRAAIAKGLETPETWKSNGQTAFCDIVYKYAEKAHKAKTKFEPRFLIEAVRDLQAGELATNAPLKVKMFKLVGHWAMEAGEESKALALFEQVMALDPKKGGVKGKINELKEVLGHGDTGNQ